MSVWDCSRQLSCVRQISLSRLLHHQLARVQHCVLLRPSSTLKYGEVPADFNHLTRNKEHFRANFRSMPSDDLTFEGK